MSAQTLSWDAMLSIINGDLELISDADMCLFFEKGIRGGVFYISKSKANNKYLKSYDGKHELKHIIYLEVNKLDGYAISKKYFFQQLHLKRIDPKEFDSNEYSSNSSKGCVLEVDLEYPKELHELHGYPLAPDKLEIKKFV